MTDNERETVVFAPSHDGQAAENPQDAPQVEDEARASVQLTQVVSDDLLKVSQHPNLQHDISFHPGKIHFYLAPQQRQTWGDSQVLPRVNWGDVFFDLFYVAAAYNFGNILHHSPSASGVLYFVGTYFPVLDNWKEKVYYDARLSLRDDIFHRIFEMCFHMANAAIILHIRPVEVMANSKDNIDMFAFSIAQVIYNFLVFAGYLEVFFLAEGQKSLLKRVASRDFKLKMVSFPFYLGAAVVSGINYYSDDNSTDNSSDDYAIRNSAESENAAAASSNFVDYLPIWLCIGGALAHFLFFLFLTQIWFPNDGSHKKFTIPLNVEFVIHRNGEWIMLMLGAGILNLLIVDVSAASDYYVTFYCGILSVVLLQYLHFRSQPHDPDNHAIRRSKDAGVWFTFINGVYSASLLVVGASYKSFLTGFADAARRLDEERILLGSEESNLSGKDRLQQIANLFGGALAILWFCTDVLMVLHLGLSNCLGRCQCSESKAINKKGLFLLTCRACLIPISATVGLWLTDPAKLAAFGLGIVIAQLLLRRLGGMYFPRDRVHGHHGDEFGAHYDFDLKIDSGELAWPNVTHVPVEYISEQECDDTDETILDLSKKREEKANNI